MELRNAKVYQNEALDLILGIPEVYPLSKTRPLPAPSMPRNRENL